MRKSKKAREVSPVSLSDATFLSLLLVELSLVEFSCRFLYFCLVLIMCFNIIYKKRKESKEKSTHPMVGKRSLYVVQVAYCKLCK